VRCRSCPSAFERNGRWIESDHYVVDYDGDAIVVHCGNTCDENLSVQFMFEEQTPYYLPHNDRIGAVGGR
jgi:hypothetical protein